MIILECEQGSEEWFAARAGIPSASKFDNIITSSGAISKSSEKYMLQLAGERLLGTKVDTYQSASMRRAVETEPEARSLYEMMHGVKTKQVGLCYKDENKNVSCSPDSLVGDDGGLEIKCPELHTHVSYLLGGKLPNKYVPQVHGSIYVTGRKWWDFMSYFPGMPPFIIRVHRDIKFMAKLGAAINIFNRDLEGTHQQLLKITRGET